MPRVEVGIHLVVVAVRLVRDALGRSEVNAGRYGLPGLVVHDFDAHPVLARLDELDTNLFGVDGATVFYLAPLHAVDLLSALRHLNGGGGNTGQLDVGGAGLRVLGLAEAPLRVRQELVGRLLRERMDVGALATVDGDVEVECLLGPLGVLECDTHGTAGVAGKGVLVDVSESYSRDDEARTSGHELDGLYHAVGGRVAPREQPVPRGQRLDGFGLASSNQVEAALVAGHEGVFPVSHGKVGMPYPEPGYSLPVADDAGLVALANWHRDGLRVLEADDVVRDVDAYWAVGVLLGLHLAVSDDEVVGSFAEGQGYGGITLSQRDVALLGWVAARRTDSERETAHGLLAQHRVLVGQEFRTCAAPVGNVDGFIVHGSKGLRG